MTRSQRNPKAEKEAKRSIAKNDKAPEPPPPPSLSGRVVRPMVDSRDEISSLTKGAERQEEAERAFITSKRRMLLTHPGFDKQVRDLVAADFEARLARGALAETPPVPGGVGYGMFYTPAFRTNFARGTSLYWRIICPTPPGGNVNTWLYLTAMNRAAFGVEALISYNGQNDTRFVIFDWARTDHWQTNIAFASLADYVDIESAHGHPYQELAVWNSTYQIPFSGRGEEPKEPNMMWRNEVLLFNHRKWRWELIYRHEYTATGSQQNTGFIGTWAPVVETFQSLYQQTNPMGTGMTMLISKDNWGLWGRWHRLGENDATIRVDNVGFYLAFLDANFSWAVDS
jgi:hypothetical protein